MRQESPVFEEETNRTETAVASIQQQPTANQPSKPLPPVVESPRTQSRPPEAPAQPETALPQTQEPNTEAEVEQEPIAVQPLAPSEVNPAVEIPTPTPSPEPEPIWDEQQAKRDIADLVERYRQRYQAGDVAGLKAMGLSVEGLTPFFKDSAERQITADPSIKFSNEETARVSVAVRVTCKIRGESRDYPFKRFWEVVYHEGHWKITSDNNAN